MRHSEADGDLFIRFTTIHIAWLLPTALVAALIGRASATVPTTRENLTSPSSIPNGDAIDDEGAIRELSRHLSTTGMSWAYGSPRKRIHGEWSNGKWDDDATFLELRQQIECVEIMVSPKSPDRHVLTLGLGNLALLQ